MSPCYQKIHTIAKNGDISKMHKWNFAKVSTTNPSILPYALYKHTPFQKVEMLRYSVTRRWRKKVSLRNLSRVPKFKAITRICMLDKVIVLAIQQNATNIWKWCLKCVVMVLPIFEKIWAPSSEFVSSSIPSWQILTAHAQPFRGPGIWLSVWRFLLTHCLYERAAKVLRAVSPEPSLLA